MAHAVQNRTRQLPSSSRVRGTLGLWAVLLLVLAVLFLLATRACGLAAFGGALRLSHCPPLPMPDPRLVVIEQERLRERSLEDRLARLRLEMVGAPFCPPVAPVEVAEAEPEPDPEPSTDLAEEAWEERRIDLLEGCWRRISNLAIDDVDTGDVYGVRTWEMCFAPDGTGEQRLEFENGAVCSGPIEADFLPDGRLRISDLQDVPCTDGRAIYAHIAECTRQADGTAECIARQPEMGREGIPSTFRR